MRVHGWPATASAGSRSSAILQTLNPDKDLRATDLFLDAADVDPAQRAAWLDEACGGDTQLRRVVEEMLAADAAATDFLERSPIDVLASFEDSLPERIGPFRVRGFLGRGGMGVVYEADQESPERQVAVKVLRSGHSSAALAARFRYEAELLGRLQHPGIAQVFAAGTCEAQDGGRPWIAMELIRGVPVARYAREQRLDAGAIIELVARIADAVHHAHQRGIVHRDLKSANVLVDEAGDPKVLDFGVARAETRDLRATLQTTPGVVVGTLQTMSPEQAEANPDLDARTDVYALGALAYELLAGRPPLDLTDAPLHVALRRVVEEEPPLLGSISRELRGDVEVVVAKALEKDRDRRYASAAALAEDLRRIGRREPVQARPASTVYLLTKLARRHLGLTLGAGLAVVATVAGLIAFVLQANKTSAAERTASAEARAAAAISEYILQDLLAAPDTFKATREVRVVDVLEKAAANAETRFAQEPELLARVRSTLGMTFVSLDRLGLAETNLRSALAIQTELHGASDERTLFTECWLLEALTAGQNTAEGVRLGRGSLQRARAALGPDHRTTLRIATNLASNLMDASELAEAESILRDVIARRERTRGADDSSTILARENLSTALQAQGRLDESLELRRQSLELRRARYGDSHPATLAARCNLAGFELQRGRLVEPVATFEELLGQVEAVFGEEHQQTTQARQWLALALDGAGRFDESIALHEQVIDTFQRALGPDNPATITAEMGLVRSLVSSGLADVAADLAGDCALRYADVEHDPVQLGALQLLAGESHIAAGRREPGCEHLRRALETLEDITLPMAQEIAQAARSALARFGDAAPR